MLMESDNNKSAKIKYVCSLGDNCLAASFLKRNSLKLASYPFDWVVSGPKVVAHCIKDDFESFLNKSLYVADNTSSTQCNHKLYHKSKLFFHHNPLDNPKDYDYFVRCVDRFRKLLKNDEKKLFIMYMAAGLRIFMRKIIPSQNEW